MTFKYALDEHVQINQTFVCAVVKGRAEFTDRPNDYCLQYVDGNGDLVYKWFVETDII